MERFVRPHLEAAQGEVWCVGIDLWYRLDGKTDHLLLDEFQDTNPVQWRILEHLAEEIVSQPGEGRSLLVVGDIKQSIYAFRQAEPRLLEKLEAAAHLPSENAGTEQQEEVATISESTRRAVKRLFESARRRPLPAPPPQTAVTPDPG